MNSTSAAVPQNTSGQSLTPGCQHKTQQPWPGRTNKRCRVVVGTTWLHLQHARLPATHKCTGLPDSPSHWNGLSTSVCLVCALLPDARLGEAARPFHRTSNTWC
jgi:hypothetical protein